MEHGLEDAQDQKAPADAPAGGEPSPQKTRQVVADFPHDDGDHPELGAGEALVPPEGADHGPQKGVPGLVGQDEDDDDPEMRVAGSRKTWVMNLAESLPGPRAGLPVRAPSGRTSGRAWRAGQRKGLNATTVRARAAMMTATPTKVGSSPPGR